MHAAPKLEFKFEISVCFCSLLFTWACVCTMWSMELILNLNSSWTCGLSVIMYFSSDGVTQQVHMVFGVLVKRINFYTRKRRKKAPKSFENHPKNRRLGLLEDFFRIFLQASSTHVPKIFLVPFLRAQTEPKGNLYLRHMFGQKCEFLRTKTTKEGSQIL